jgi:hypothetical protein
MATNNPTIMSSLIVMGIPATIVMDHLPFIAL